ncbi:MAG: hypothetical protein AAGI30_01655 [Planctomycetota bacterium]
MIRSALMAASALAVASSAHAVVLTGGPATLDSDDTVDVILSLDGVTGLFNEYILTVVFDTNDAPSASEFGDEFSIDIDAEFAASGSGLPNFLDLEALSNPDPTTFTIVTDTLTVADELSPSGFVPGLGFVSVPLPFDASQYQQIEVTFGSTPGFEADILSVQLELVVPAPGAAGMLAIAGLATTRRRR